jgi:Holliday junction resolvase RusA-like endonuclease
MDIIDLNSEEYDENNSYGSSIVDVTKYGYYCTKTKNEKGESNIKYEMRLNLTVDRFPSCNNMYQVVMRSGKPMIIKSVLAKKFASEIQKQINTLNVKFPVFPEQKLAVSYAFYFTDNRRRDLDNHLKVLNDALTSYVWGDDSQIFRCMTKKIINALLPSPRVEIHVLLLEDYCEDIDSNSDEEK